MEIALSENAQESELHAYLREDSSLVSVVKIITFYNLIKALDEFETSADPHQSELPKLLKGLEKIGLHDSKQEKQCQQTQMLLEK